MTSREYLELTKQFVFETGVKIKMAKEGHELIMSPVFGNVFEDVVFNVDINMERTTGSRAVNMFLAMLEEEEVKE